jgi:KUP system potassium uptake protein
MLSLVRLALMTLIITAKSSPVFAFRFFIRKKTEGWKMLGGVLLAFTGVEALFADLGAFVRLSAPFPVVFVFN